MVKLSIMIPYFETYELTKRLMDGLQVQLTDETEIILIDDGCNEDRLDVYNKDKRIRVIHQENKGTAKTRNLGIDIAKGKYVAFIDCDDMVTMDYVVTLLEAIDKYDTDVINLNWYDMSTHQEIRKPQNYAMWKAIYRRENMPKFLEGCEYGHEDVPFQAEIVSGKYEIIYLDKLLYFYNSNREGSLICKKTHRS